MSDEKLCIGVSTLGAILLGFYCTSHYLPDQKRTTH